MARPTETDKPVLQCALDELQVAAAAGDLSALQDAERRWDANIAAGTADVPPQNAAGHSWFVPTIPEKLLLSEKGGGSYAWLAFQRVLDTACKEGRADVVAYLLDQRGCSITHSAVKSAFSRSCWEVMQVFLDRGWDINSPIGNNLCPIMRPVIPSETHVRWCLEHGADPMARNQNGSLDILSAAGRTAPVKVLRLLKEYGADLRKSNALHDAARSSSSKRMEVMEYLLDECLVPINQREYEYDSELFEKWKGEGLGTALHCAVEVEDLDRMNFLLERGVEPDILDTSGRKAVELARARSFEAGLRLLEQS